MGDLFKRKGDELSFDRRLDFFLKTIKLIDKDLGAKGM